MVVYGPSHLTPQSMMLGATHRDLVDIAMLRA